jgi:hypothetical protein
MGKLIRLVVVVLVVYGCWQAASAQWDQFKFEDAVRQLAAFGADQTDETLRAAVGAEAGLLGIRIEPSHVSIRRAAEHIYIDIEYVRPVQILPWYQYNWAFAVKVDSWRVPGGRLK